MFTWPLPPEDSVPLNAADGATLDPGERVTFTFTSTQAGATMMVPVIAASKFPQARYEVQLDGSTVYGPAPVPPTDVDDLAATFHPARQAQQQIEIVVSNLSSSTTRVCTAQAIGWEVI